MVRSVIAFAVVALGAAAVLAQNPEYAIPLHLKKLSDFDD